VLKENPYNPDPSRKWFSDEYCDLIVWYDAQQKITGFQLCYDVRNNEHALTWQEGKGFDHHRIDSGETQPQMNMTPILIPDGAVPYQKLLHQFKERASGLDPEIFELVIRTLSEAG